MQKISATYEIVTPMFIGDANQEATGISAAAVKGALRFWWRALNWGSIRNNCNSDEEALCKLHKREGVLFGRSSKIPEENGKEIGGQGKFILRVKSQNQKGYIELSTEKLNSHFPLSKTPWITYLLGMGLMEYNKKDRDNRYTRSALSPEKESGLSEFTVELIGKELDSLKPALEAWGMLGGLGSRNRHGLGSVTLKKLDGVDAPNTREQYIGKLKKIVSETKKTIKDPPFTAFSGGMRLSVSPTEGRDWLSLNNLAKIMQLYRGWGYKGNNTIHKINNTKVDPDAHTLKNSDHCLLMRMERSPHSVSSLPASAVFGLPRSYVISSRSAKIKLEPSARTSKGKEDTTNKRSRRASPLFIHAHKLGDGSFVVTQLFLPSLFLPTGDEVKLEHEINKHFINKATLSPLDSTQWQVITEYLDLNDFNAWDNVI